MQYCAKCFIVIVANFIVIIVNGYTELFGRPEVILKVNSHKEKLIKKAFGIPMTCGHIVINIYFEIDFSIFIFVFIASTDTVDLMETRYSVHFF